MSSEDHPPEPEPAAPQPAAVPHDDDKVVSEEVVRIESSDIKPVRRFRERRLLVELVKDEVVRATVALLLLALLTYIVIQAFSRANTWTDTKQLLDQLLPAVTALLGSAVGFYFGTKA